ncbi:hypothetical protein [Salimicrobium flavidum]|uniref:Uncharacterized protein n=1 Tax=Salimicrobium flavidum TaxID=570947 RepID=A0A1N7J8E0_9BACI|nr:hypothetical protein [Salimicrobium flavidum]SIS45506.1 hypothetical protein SAMN05421687_104119 [Salimicrobium flavidum]
MSDEDKSLYWMMGIGYLGISLIFAMIVTEGFDRGRNEDFNGEIGFALMIMYIYHLEKRFGIPRKVRYAARGGMLLVGATVAAFIHF